MDVTKLSWTEGYDCLHCVHAKVDMPDPIYHYGFIVPPYGVQCRYNAPEIGACDVPRWPQMDAEDWCSMFEDGMRQIPNWENFEEYPDKVTLRYKGEELCVIEKTQDGFGVDIRVQGASGMFRDLSGACGRCHELLEMRSWM